MVVTRQHRSESGFSLVELLVAMFVLGIVLTGLTSAAMSIYRASNQVDLATRNQNEARTAITVLSRDVRAAAPVRPNAAFRIARPNEAVFTALLDDAPRQQLVRIFVDEQNRLVEDTTPPDEGLTPEGNLNWNVDGNSRVRFIATFVSNDDTQPMFRYLDADGDEFEMSTTACDAPGGTTVAPPCLTPEQRNSIAIVELSLSISSDPGDRVRQFTVQQGVRLPNT